MIWQSPNGKYLIANHKVFSTAIAQRLANQSFLAKLPTMIKKRIHLQILSHETSSPLHLLVADPVTRFFAACREERFPPWVALIEIRSGPQLSPHFLPQARHLARANEILLYRAPEHIDVFWQDLNLGNPPEIYSPENSTEFVDQIREIYSADQELFDSIKNPRQLAKKTNLLSTVTQLRSVATATARFIRHGAPTTPPEALTTREATCRACPEWDAAALNGTGRCRKCGCSTWAKLRMATERCPLGKWEAVTPAP